MESINSRVVEDVYKRCYYRVYHGWPIKNVGQHWEKIVDNSREARVTLEMFILINIAAYKITHPKSSFFPSILAAESAWQKIEMYTSLCRKQHGHLSPESLGLTLEEDLSSIDDGILHSEITVGRFIVGWKLRGQGPWLKSLYYEHELTLDPYWLCIEPTYIESVLKPHLRNPTEGTDAQKKFRHEVTLHHAMLKRRKTLAASVFASRSKMMSTAVQTVLQFNNLNMDDFTHADQPVKDAFKFWNVLGLAVAHWECIKATSSLPHVLWR